MLTILEAIWTVFPYGTELKPIEAIYRDENPPAEVSIDRVPETPFDLFAIAGYLIEIGGAYHWLIAAKNQTSAPKPSLGITQKCRTKLEIIGLEWSKKYAPPKEVKRLWKKLLKYGNRPICNSTNGNSYTAKRPPVWLKSAYSLFVIADSASQNVGYRETVNQDWSERWVIQLGNQILEGGKSSKKSGHVRLSEQRASLTSIAVNDDIICVQPKAKIPGLGCSMRNLSHSLAILPPRGKIAACWMLPQVPKPDETFSDLNVLLIPFPYVIPLSAFDVSMEEEGKTGRWGWFKLRQTWLNSNENEIINFVDALLRESSKKMNVNGIVFPEFALNYAIYEKLAIHVRDNHSSVEFIVSGASGNCAEQEGNFALSTHFFEVEESGKITRMMATTSRPKHHRWALNSEQIQKYKLCPQFPTPLNSTDIWWEKISIPPRQIHFHPMRSGSIYSVMICEDLARSDPVHDPLKAVGPNLVFVLLFDGPQLERRWSTRQATSLTEDPGSSVITITSRALVEKWNSGKESEKDDGEHSWAVATWKDKTERARLLKCPPGNEAVLVSLKGEQAFEATLDGRQFSDSYNWVFTPKEEHLIRLDRSEYKDLLISVGAE